VENQDRDNFGKRPNESPQRASGSGENPSGPSASPNLTPVGETTSTYTSAGPGSTATGAASAKSLYEQAKDTAGHAYDAATERAASKFDEKKSNISGGLSNVADSVRTVSQNLKSTDAQNAITSTTAKYTDAAARKLENVANYFESNDLRQLMRDAEDFARKNPAVFIGGAAVLGLLAARFLKSSKPKYLQASAGEPWSSSERGNIGGPASRGDASNRRMPNQI
jgi:ElaB/YqjD/DUF883 family membrane-anchored ribosome-binding protein